MSSVWQSSLWQFNSWNRFSKFSKPCSLEYITHIYRWTPGIVTIDSCVKWETLCSSVMSFRGAVIYITRCKWCYLLEIAWFFCFYIIAGVHLTSVRLSCIRFSVLYNVYIPAYTLPSCCRTVQDSTFSLQQRNFTTALIRQGYFFGVGEEGVRKRRNERVNQHDIWVNRW